MTVEEMQDNLLTLANDLECRLDQQPNMAGMMYVEFGYVEGPTITDELSVHYPNAESRYLVCLHELGHYHHGHTQGRPWTEEYREKAFGWPKIDEAFWADREWYFNNGVLHSEAEAWNYALDKCGIPSDEIKPETRQFMWETCLGSYFNHARSVGFETPGQLLYNGDRAHVRFAYGKPDNYFFQTKRRIVEGDDEEVKEQDSRTIDESQIIEFQIDTNNIQWIEANSLWNSWQTAQSNTARR